MVETVNYSPNIEEARKTKAHAPEFEIIKYISQFMHLTEAEAEAIVQNINFRAFKKGDFLLKEGQVSNLCYFNLKGCVRQYYLIDGEEKTTNFYTEGQPIAPNEGLFKKMPSKF